jgi:hypothetical protein
MMTMWQFEAALRALSALQMHELANVGAIDEKDLATWNEFKADPVDWFLTHPHKAEAVWRAVCKHRPQPEIIPTPSNLVDVAVERWRKKSS